MTGILFAPIKGVSHPATAAAAASSGMIFEARGSSIAGRRWRRRPSSSSTQPLPVPMPMRVKQPFRNHFITRATSENLESALARIEKRLGLGLWFMVRV